MGRRRCKKEKKTQVTEYAERRRPAGYGGNGRRKKRKRKSDARNTVDGKMLTAINISRVNRGETDAKLSVCP